MPKNGMVRAEFLNLEIPTLVFPNYTNIFRTTPKYHSLGGTKEYNIPSLVALFQLALLELGMKLRPLTSVHTGRTVVNCQLSNETIFSTGSTYLWIEM